MQKRSSGKQLLRGFVVLEDHTSVPQLLASEATVFLRGTTILENLELCCDAKRHKW